MTAVASSHTVSLSLYYQNVRGLNTKLNKFYNAVSACDYQILACTETWLHGGVGDAEIVDTARFLVFRSDRDREVTGCSRGGGVMLIVDNNLTAEVVKLPSFSHIKSAHVDAICVRIGEPSRSFFLIVLYVQPSANSETFNDIFELLCTVDFMYASDVLLVGDFNITEYASSRNSFISSNKIRIFNNMVTFFGLQQTNFVMNSHDRILDLIVTNMSTTVSRASDVLILEDPHHPAIDLILGLPVGRRHTAAGIFASGYKYNFRKTNFISLYNQLYCANWDFLTEFADVEAACRAFYAHLSAIFDSCVPRMRIKSSGRKYPPWFDSELTKNLYRKRKAWKRYRSTNSPSDHAEFKRLRNLCEAQSRNCFRNYHTLMENNIKTDVSSFWRFVNYRRSDQTSQTTIRDNGRAYTDPGEICDAFARQFQNSYVDSRPHGFQHTLNTGHDDVWQFSDQETLRALLRLKAKFTSGPDGIPAFLIRDCAAVLSVPLTFLFNLSLRTCTFPSDWKLSNSVPVPKKGDKSEITNYRQIIIMNNFAKVLEFLLVDKIELRARPLITGAQHGFVRGRSTVTNLACITEFISDAMDRGCQTDVIYTDFSKAFDMVDHGVLIDKLFSFGFSAKQISFMQSYLSDRKHRVIYRGCSSAEVYASSGVPQGSVLGPTLFNLFINDLSDILNVPHLFYADDLKLFHTIIDVDDCLRLQRNLGGVDEWCKLNNLKLNVQKCNVMTFSRKTDHLLFDYKVSDQNLRRQNTFCDLGVIFDRSLTFNDHIASTVTKAVQSLGFIIRCCRNFKDTKTLIMLYNTIVRSRLEYASVVWSPLYTIHKQELEAVHRRFLKYLAFKIDGSYPPIGYPQDRLLARFEMDSLEHRRHMAYLTFLYKLVNGYFDCSQLSEKLKLAVPTYSSRHINLFYLPTPRTNILQRAPLFVACSLYNGLHGRVDISRDSLKSILTAACDVAFIAPR